MQNKANFWTKCVMPRFSAREVLMLLWIWSYVSITIYEKSIELTRHRPLQAIIHDWYLFTANQTLPSNHTLPSNNDHKMPSNKDNKMLSNKDSKMPSNNDNTLPSNYTDTLTKQHVFNSSASPPKVPSTLHQPKFVLLLAYQRVGSSFTGKMFNANPDMLYVYEPLDGVYTRLYGTVPGWAVPSDLHFHWNVTWREKPKAEKEAISGLIEQIFTCDYDHMMAEHLIHDFWTALAYQFVQATPYIRCLNTLQVSLGKCRRTLGATCPQRIGENLQKQARCAAELRNIYNTSVSGKRKTAYSNYRICTEAMRRAVLTKCVPVIKDICTNKSARVIKTVRLDMDTVEQLIEKYPGNMRILHMIRDPRGVVLSRMKSSWSQLGSTNAKNAKKVLDFKQVLSKEPKSVKENTGVLQRNKSMSEFTKEAKVYCTLALRDIQKRKEIEERYPGTTLEIVYEDLVKNPTEIVNGIYKFLGLRVHAEVGKWLKQVASSKAASQKVAGKWESQIPGDVVESIDKTCTDLYWEMGNKWEAL